MRDVQHGEINAIDVIDAFKLNYALGNVIERVLYAGRTGDAIADLRKAIDYLHHEIEQREKQNKSDLEGLQRREQMR